mgnify:CR=1 FL=1
MTAKAVKVAQVVVESVYRRIAHPVRTGQQVLEVLFTRRPTLRLGEQLGEVGFHRQARVALGQEVVEAGFHRDAAVCIGQEIIEVCFSHGLPGTGKAYIHGAAYSREVIDG